MKRPPIFTHFAVAIATVLVPSALHATGDFYEEPLISLPNFLRLDQLPAKTFEQILSETAKTEPDVEAVEVEKEIAGFKDLKGAQVLAQIDKLVLRARATQDIPALNLLNDLRDLYAGPANAEETEEYVAWRTGNPTFSAEDLEAQLKDASPALRPHFQYLMGAVLFLDRNDTDSQVWFEKVVKEFPKHPRAEVALYMAGRCQISRSRTGSYMRHSPDLNQDQRPRARQLLEQYLAKYPKGRWAGDATGWLGAWFYDGGDYAEALRCYLQQIDYPDHPELRSSAMLMCELTLSHLASAPRDKAWAGVARYPEAAQALVYLLLNSSESDNYNGELDSPDAVRAWRKKLLPQVAAAIAAQDKLYKDATWRPRYLATLALAASGAGQQEQALKLLATAGAEVESDDLLLARGVVLMRARRSAEAIPVLRALLEKFPKSPLRRGAHLRLGMALADDHQAGQAILELDRMLVKPKEPTAAAPAADAPVAAAEEPEEDESDSDPGAYPIHTEVADDQIRQLIDLWLNFAPIEELAAPVRAAGFDPVQRLRFTEPIAQRSLAREQFDEAKKYLTPAQYGLFAEPIEKLTIAAKEAKEPAARAAAFLALGDAWSAARGKLLTYPLDTDRTRKEVYPNEDVDANVRRADAAAVFGYTGNFRLDLENRDELRHAFNWWLEASDAQPGSATTAKALWQALRAMPLIADVSPFTYERARFRKWNDVAQKLYDRLRTECADSVEAKRYAVTWNFPGPRRRGPDEYPTGDYRGPAGATLPAATAFGVEEGYPEHGPVVEAIGKEVEALMSKARTEKPADLRASLERSSTWARKTFSGLYDARFVNFYEDLALFFSEPDPGPEVRGRYVEMRARFLDKSAVSGHGFDSTSEDRPDADGALQKQIAAALADATTKPVADYFEFLDLAVVANHFTFVKLENAPKDKEDDILEKGEAGAYRTRDYPLLAKKTRAFLAKYPKSKKREAALLLHARAVYRGSEEVTLQNYASWPQGGRWEGGYINRVTSQAPFDAKAVLAALDAYDQAFPKGRYASDIRDYRAGLALRQRDWKTALELSLAQFEDQERPDLQASAANHLGKIFDQLADERYRTDLLPLIKASPRARELLVKYLAFEFGAHPLRYLDKWLQDQLAKR